MTTRTRPGADLTKRECELVAELVMIKRAMRELKTNCQLKAIGKTVGREFGNPLRPFGEEVEMAQLTARAREIVALLGPQPEPAAPVAAVDPATFGSKS